MQLKPYVKLAWNSPTRPSLKWLLPVIFKTRVPQISKWKSSACYTSSRMSTILPPSIMQITYKAGLKSSCTSPPDIWCKLPNASPPQISKWKSSARYKSLLSENLPGSGMQVLYMAGLLPRQSLQVPLRSKYNLPVISSHKSSYCFWEPQRYLNGSLAERLFFTEVGKSSS